MPQEAEIDNFDDDAEVAPAKAKPVPEAPAKPKFPATMVRRAESLGISPEDIESCSTTTELRDMIAVEMDAARAERGSQTTSGGAAETRGQKPIDPPPEVSPEADEEWKYDEEFEAVVDPAIKREVKKIVERITKAKKSGDKDEAKALKAQLDAVNAKLERMESRSHPLVRRFAAHTAKYAALFGEDFDEDGNPPAGTPEAVRYHAMMNHILARDAEGKFVRRTGNPEKDIDAAVKVLFPGHELNTDDAPAKPGKNGSGSNRIKDWVESGQAPTTQRNGADRSGVPGGEKAAVRKVAEKLKARGIDPGHIDDDEDDEI